MKKTILLLILVLLSINFAKAQDQMYIMKAGEIKGQHTVTAVDSIIFYAPPAIPVSQIILTSNAESVFAGQNIDLSTFISSIEPATASDKTVTWSSSSSAISISNASTGAATAGAVGTTAVVTVTANDGSLVSNAITFTVTAEAPNTYYQGAIANAKYIGRWQKDGAFDRSGYNGAMIKVNFTGTTAILNTNTDYAKWADLFYKIDNGPWVLKTGVVGPLNLTPTPLSNGEHTLVIVAGAVDTQPTHKIYASTLDLDTGAETLPPSNLSNKHIDFIGDSISTICYEDNTPDEHWNWLIGEQLGWEHAHIAMPSMTTAYMSDAYSNYFYSKQGTWDFSTAYKTHAIVINLGQNDAGKPSVATYRAAIELVRSVQPNIPIICIGLFWDLGNGADVNIETAVNEVRAAGDTDVHYLGDAVGLSASLHPQDGEHQVISDALTPKIQAILNLYY